MIFGLLFNKMVYNPDAGSLTKASEQKSELGKVAFKRENIVTSPLIISL
jgi:hypothetical protein